MQAFHKQCIPINSRSLTVFDSLENELTYDSNKNYVFDLSYLCALHVIGEQAETFLQGQLSCDIRHVNYAQMQQGAFCDLKGRILALLDVVHWYEHGLHLILPHDLSEKVHMRLMKTAMLSRVSLKLASRYHILGFYYQNDADRIPLSITLPNKLRGVSYQNGICCYYLGNDCYVLLVEFSLLESIRSTFIKNGQWRGSLAWHALQLQHQRMEIYPESSGAFLPHRLDLHKTDYVSFDKGCYKGQEIIARMHYRGKLKHELKTFIMQTEQKLQSGQRLMSADGTEEIGELIDYCPVENGYFRILASVLSKTPGDVPKE